MKKFIEDFKKFAMRGNLVDMVIGITVGLSFGQVVNSFVNDILMPPLGIILGGVDFSGLKIKLVNGTAWNYGNFIQTIINFLIIALAVYFIIRLMGRIIKRQEAQKEVKINRQEQLLSEIRDILKSKQN